MYACESDVVFESAAVNVTTTSIVQTPTKELWIWDVYSSSYA